jgi:ribosomal protein L29
LALKRELAALRAEQAASQHQAAVAAATAQVAAEANATVRLREMERELAASRAALAVQSVSAECCIYLSASKNAAFMPCGHACVCVPCGNAIAAQHNATCPVCSVRVTGVMQVFT